MEISRKSGNNRQKTSTFIDLSNVHDDNELTY